MSNTFVFDTEVYVNCTLFCAQEVDTGERFHVWRDEPDSVEKLRDFVNRSGAEFIGFNSNYFDNVVVNAWLSGKDSSLMKNLANQLIVDRVAPWVLNRSNSYQRFDSIDLMGAAPPFMGLKALGARMNMSTLQDLPVHPDDEISAEQKDLLLNYCWNDVETTLELTRRLDSQLRLRVNMSREYGMDLRSKSDAQLAERSLTVVLGLEKKRVSESPKTVTYTPPEYLSFRNTKLQNLLEKISSHEFIIQPSGHPENPMFLAEVIYETSTGRYQLGVGGVHSVHDKSICHVASSDRKIVDIDAASFYPSMIIQNNFVPSGIGQRFVDEFKKIYERRLAAKKAGDKETDASLKVTINSVFGQFGNRYSVLYSPDLLLAVTLTGQLTLLMLVEKLEEAGATCLSANTDGIAVSYRAESESAIHECVDKFSILSKLVFEYTPYRVLAMKDVNSYFAVKTDRKIKAKGIYAEPSLKKNLTADVCAYAVGQWLAHGTPFLETIQNAGFPSFLSARNVTGGGEQNGVYLGKVVRWYQSNDKTLPPLRYVKNGNLVPKTTGARACMVLPSETPADCDYNWYYREALLIAKAVGCWDYLSKEEQELITVIKPERKRKNAK